MTRRHGLGLRAQVVLALSLAFMVSFALLGFAAIQLTQRAQAADRLRAARTAAQLLATAFELPSRDTGMRFATLAAAARGAHGIAGVEIERTGLMPEAHGLVGVGVPIEASLASGGVVRVWVRPPDPAAGAPLANLLLLYVAVTGGGILLLAFIALTHWIIRPVEALTRASERLAAGGQHAGVPVRGAAEVARLAVAFNDMAAQLRTERLALEDRLAQLERTTAELRSAQEQVVRNERLASVGRLSAGVAHEIGNPLAAILGLIELVRMGGLDAAQQAEFLARIQGETERIHVIIRSLLDFSRHGGETQDDNARSDLRQVVEDAVRLIAPQKDLRHVTIERRLEETPLVRGSADRLTQLVLNLLLNAADAIHGDGNIRVEVFPDEDRERVVLVVADSGPGIANDVLARLFEPFVTTKPPGEGTGLGLAVCHTIVTQLGGIITADNPKEGGARFEVRLPTARDAGSPQGT